MRRCGHLSAGTRGVLIHSEMGTGRGRVRTRAKDRLDPLLNTVRRISVRSLIANIWSEEVCPCGQEVHCWARLVSNKTFSSAKHSSALGLFGKTATVSPATPMTGDASADRGS